VVQELWPKAVQNTALHAAFAVHKLGCRYGFKRIGPMVAMHVYRNIVLRRLRLNKGK
jgi:hypothetical protein